MLFNKSFLPSPTHLSLLSLSLISSLGIINSLPTLAAEKDVNTDKEQLLAQTPSRNLPPNGTYLYGTSGQPDEIGQEYMVFQVYQGEIKGAVYMPKSEFSCFTGTFAGNQMTMSIVDPYDGTKYPYSVSLEIPSPVARNDQWSDLSLEGYHRLDAMSSNDQRILDTCLD
ncbi:MAG: hypothetical protein WBM62_18035 [Crocosphaera sp.]|jgi:hypothetical protein